MYPGLKWSLITGVYLCSEGPMFRGSYVPSFLEKTRNIGPSEHRPFYPLVRSYVPRVLSSEPKAKGRDGLAFFVLDYWDYLLSSSVPVRSQLPVELRLALNLNNITHPHPHTTASALPCFFATVSTFRLNHWLVRSSVSRLKYYKFFSFLVTGGRHLPHRQLTEEKKSKCFLF